MPEDLRCSAASLARSEPMAGTASTVRSWLLLEHPGPWGVHAFRDARLPEGFGPALLERCRAARVRPLLIRRVGASATGGACVTMRSGPEAPWIERTRLGRIEDALELDLDALGRGERLGLEPVPGPLFLVCTHGRHDACCAERGRPLGRALERAEPDRTWECSHVGGDRFAATMVAFPHGMYFGRVAEADGPAVAAGYRGGRVDLPRYRGRSCHPMPVQAAEHALRVERGLEGVDDVALERARRAGEEVAATFATSVGRFAVRVRVQPGEPHHLTCRGATEEPAPVYRIEAIEPVLQG